MSQANCKRCGASFKSLKQVHVFCTLHCAQEFKADQYRTEINKLMSEGKIPATHKQQRNRGQDAMTIKIEAAREAEREAWIAEKAAWEAWIAAREAEREAEKAAWEAWMAAREAADVAWEVWMAAQEAANAAREAADAALEAEDRE